MKVLKRELIVIERIVVDCTHETEAPTGAGWVLELYEVKDGVKTHTWERIIEKQNAPTSYVNVLTEIALEAEAIADRGVKEYWRRAKVIGAAFERGEPTGHLPGGSTAAVVAEFLRAAIDAKLHGTDEPGQKEADEP